MNVRRHLSPPSIERILGTHRPLLGCRLSARPERAAAMNNNCLLSRDNEHVNQMKCTMYIDRLLRVEVPVRGVRIMSYYIIGLYIEAVGR